MTAYVALLRAVNIGSHNQVGMADLRALAERLGLREVRTILQSGNLVFRSAGAAAEPIERRLERETRKTLGVDTDFFVRTAKEWGAAVAANPFVSEAKQDPGHLLLMCLDAAPAREAAHALEAAIKGRERVHVEGRHAWLVYPDGVGRSKLTIRLIESKLQARGTARNWNTVLKLRDLLA